MKLNDATIVCELISALDASRVWWIAWCKLQSVGRTYIAKSGINARLKSGEL
jgi:hypothetical protein